MKRSIPLILVGLSAGFAATAAVDVSKLPAASTRKGLSYAKDIKPLFEASCTRCHGEERQRGGLRLDTLQGVLAGGENGKILVSGKGHESGLVQAVSQLDEETVMPSKRGGGRGGPGGPGGPGGGRGFGPGRFLGPGLFGVADSNHDGSPTSAEWKGTFNGWFTKWDEAKAGSVTEDQARDGLNTALPAPQFGGGGRQGGPGGPGGPGAGPGGGFGGGFGGGPGGGPQDKPFTPEEVGLVRAWVHQGAKP